MSQGRTLRIRDVGAYLGVSKQRADQMFDEGKLPEPDRVDGISPMWKLATIER
jgi:predicted DNA-binding transcriptional regulator AlpA